MRPGLKVDLRIADAIGWKGEYVPAYSTELIAALGLLDEFKTWRIDKDWPSVKSGPEQYSIWLDEAGGWHYGPTIAMAICAAVLAAKGKA